jgi:glycosyltransferase involved in cell wall biosynthesis
MFRRKQTQWENLKKVVITTPSGWLADRVRCSFLKDRDIRVVYNGVDTKNVFYRRDTKALREEHGLTDEKIVLTVAPKLMGERKGGRWVVQLARQMKDENIKFIMVGIEDMSQKFPDNVIPIARTANQHKLAEYYSMADCFVICSDKETFSMTCAESLCCGTPIAGFCSGAPETVFLQPHAVFGTYGDLDELEKNVKLQLNAAFDREKLAKEMQQLYSRDSMYENFMNIYKELTNEV